MSQIRISGPITNNEDDGEEFIKWAKKELEPRETLENISLNHARSLAALWAAKKALE